MILLDEHNAAEFLRARGWIGPTQEVVISVLSGGVSNQVLYVARPGSDDFVLKQARPQLRVKDDWFCSVERIWIEVRVMRICSELLITYDRGRSLPSTPRILHEDRENFAFAMTAAPRDHRVWRADLLSGQADEAIAAACGQMLGQLHAGSWHNESIKQALSDRQIFDELRLDPYYRTVARRLTEAGTPEFAVYFERLVDSIPPNLHSLVHADFSPKNLLVFDGGLTMVDFETGHYGDPAFDLGFFLSHLVLKSFYHAGRHRPFVALATTFWRNYRSQVEPAVGAHQYAALEARGLQHLAGCAWARLDGKSPVDYLVEEPRRSQVRVLCQKIFSQSPSSWSSVCEWADQLISELN